MIMLLISFGDESSDVFMKTKLKEESADRKEAFLEIFFPATCFSTKLGLKPND